MTNNIGKRAIITNTGKEYTTYEWFAKAHGYPDAAVDLDSNDRRKPLKDGEEVTILAKGTHEWSEKTILYIIECSNGERHIIEEEGLRILDDHSTETTVLADESLGGVLREYRNVMRPAKVGEKVCVHSHPVDKANGVFVVDRVDYDGHIHYGQYGRRPYGYAVLEPTNIVVIDGERFRVVDRKASSGERVIIVDTSFPSNYDLGECFTVAKYEPATKETLAGVIINDLKGRRGANIPGFVKDGKYRVLEPVGSLVKLPESAIAKQIEGLTETVAKLSLRVTELEKRDLSLKTSSPAVPAKPSLARDEIVEKAKHDVAKIIEDLYGDADRNAFSKYGTPGHMIVKFEVNREKRTVVALIGWRYVSGIKNRGIAKCAPDDCFNVHIGKAIALRRALGLKVPEEYVEAPQPTEPRVGDIVESMSFRKGLTGPVVKLENYRKTNDALLFANPRATRSDGNVWIFADEAKIIDDSREVTAREEVAAA